MCSELAKHQPSFANQVVTLTRVTNWRLVTVLFRSVQFTCCERTLKKKNNDNNIWVVVHCPHKCIDCSEVKTFIRPNIIEATFVGLKLNTWSLFLSIETLFTYKTSDTFVVDVSMISLYDVGLYVLLFVVCVYAWWPKKLYIFQHTISFEHLRQNKTDFTKMFPEFLKTKTTNYDRLWL